MFWEGFFAHSFEIVKGGVVGGGGRSDVEVVGMCGSVGEIGEQTQGCWARREDFGSPK